MKEGEELEEKLQIYKERLEDAMDTGNLAWWEMELPSGEVSFNDRKVEMLGYPPEKFEHYTDFTDIIHPEDHDKAMKAMEDHLEGRAEKYEVEYRIEKDDGDYKWFRDVGSITEEDGEYKKVTGIVIDIDERKRIQEHERFLHSLLRHDVKNKIQIIMNYIEVMKKHDIPSDLMDYLDKAKNASDESREIIEKVRKLSKIGEEEEIGERDLSSVMDEVISEHQDRLTEMGINLDVDEFEFKVKGGPLLEDMFSNLVGNSIRHSDCETIRITSHVEEERCIVSVEDDGVGISDEIKEKIFKKGFKKGESAGTGLGLYMVKMIAENYGGNVEVKDSDLGGARFDVHLKRT